MKTKINLSITKEGLFVVDHPYHAGKKSFLTSDFRPEKISTFEECYKLMEVENNNGNLEIPTSVRILRTRMLSLESENYSLFSNIEKLNDEIASLKKDLKAARRGYKDHADYLTSLRQKKINKIAEGYEDKGFNKKDAATIAESNKFIRHYVINVLNGKKIHPNYYSGSGRYRRKSADWASEICNYLKSKGYKVIIGNDAPRGGYSGYYVELSNK